MEINELKKMPISHLVLIILDEKNNICLRKFAEIELKERIKHLGTQYDDLMQSELEVIIISSTADFKESKIYKT